MANIKVAVRVRPISAREVNLTGSEVVVRTDANGISLTNLKVSSSKAGDSRERTRRYGFDYCFDSSDPKAEDFADQAKIYETLGQSVLEALFSGYNSCLVAYGQSASGKTYTMMGTKDDPGLTPRLCQGLFARIEQEMKNEKNYRVSVSYLEIYNERVRDLLKPSSNATGLRVREHPRLGPYVQGLTHHVVSSLGSLMSYVEEGSKARKTASTLQNPSSSRSHALLTIGVVEETPNVANGAVQSASSTRRRSEIVPKGSSKLRLVDLAGSESAATCSGVHRLKEGANINKSLVALGNVISALAERGSTGSGPGRRFIPYRDSSLTWLLKDALGGNATTIMLATISPASGSYNETAHTLRFAQRAQSVVNRPVVNENPVARIVRELRAEVARLKALLSEKNTEPCSCHKDRSIEDQRSHEELIDSETIERSKEVESDRKEEDTGWLVPIRRSNSSDKLTRNCETCVPKKFGSFELLTAGERFASYNRAKVTELNDEEDEVSEFHESVFVDIPTLVAVLIKPDDNLQVTSTQIEEICSDEVAEDSIDFIETANEPRTFVNAKRNDRSSVNSCTVENEVDVHRNKDSTVSKPKQKPKFRKQDSVDVLSPVPSNLQSLKRFGSVETIQRKKDPPFTLERSHTNLEKRYTLADKKKLNNIREIDDLPKTLQRKGSNDSDKSLKERSKSQARKSSSENLKRKTSKDSSSSSSKDEQILISSLSRDKLLRRKSSLEQEPASIKSHTPIQRVKRAEIVAAVTERLYSSRKSGEDVPEVRSPPETANQQQVKSLARMKLQEISRKMLGKRRRVCAETQTDCLQTIRLKDTASLTETPQIICKDVGVLTEDHESCEHRANQSIPVLRVKEVATLTEKPKTSIVRCKDIGCLATDLEDFDYEIHSPRNDSGILSDDTQNYAESNLSSTEVSDLCQESDRRVAYAESSTNTVLSSPCRSFAVQTPRLLENKVPTCLRQCCNSSQGSGTRSSSIEKNIISISLPDTISITIETSNASESTITLENDCSRGKRKSGSVERETQTEESKEAREGSVRKDSTRSTLSQTDSRVFRIENIFQDPNNVSTGSKVDVVADRTKGARNSITFRNSLGTSYVFEGKDRETGVPGTEGNSHQREGFIRDGLITEAFITRKRGFNSKRPSSIVYHDPWRNWSLNSPTVNSIHSTDYGKGSWQGGEIPLATSLSIVQENNREEPEDVEGILQKNSDHDHGFSDDSLDYNENLCSESITKLKEMMKQRESFCPPDVVAHTKKDSPKTENNEGVDDFEDSHVEFPKKNSIESMETTPIHDYKSLILGKPCCNYEEVNEEANDSSNRGNHFGRKKVSFLSSDTPDQTRSKQSPRTALKPIIKERRKKVVSDVAHSSNEETDDSRQEDKGSSSFESEWKGDAQSTSSEDTSKEQVTAGSSRDHTQSRKKVKFSDDELRENTCSESDEYVDDEEEDEFPSASRNILEEYLTEAVTFMRNLNSINGQGNDMAMLERNAESPSHGRGGKRASHRSYLERNRDYEEATGRRVSPKDTEDPAALNDDIVSTESYERCMKGIERLEECIRRVDKHNELLREKYGVECESAGARLSLASPSTDPRVTNDQFTNHPRERTRSNVTEQPATIESKDNDLEKRIFDQLMNVANSVRCGSSDGSRYSGSRSQSPGSYSRSREKHGQTSKESFYGDVSGCFSLGSNTEDNDQQNFTTYEITGNLSVGRTSSVNEIVDDDLDSVVEDDFLPLRRFNRFSWLPNETVIDDTLTDASLKLDSLPNYKLSTTYDSRMRDNFPVQRVPFDSTRRKEFKELDDYSRRIRNGSSKVCGCTRDQDIESSTSELLHLRDKLKYPASPRARFLELLRERRRIVEYSRGTSAT